MLSIYAVVPQGEINSMERLKTLFEPGSFLAICWTCLIALFAQLGTFAAVIGLFVLLYQLKSSYFRSKLDRAKYEKFCTELRDKRID